MQPPPALLLGLDLDLGRPSFMRCSSPSMPAELPGLQSLSGPPEWSEGEGEGERPSRACRPLPENLPPALLWRLLPPLLLLTLPGSLPGTLLPHALGGVQGSSRPTGAPLHDCSGDEDDAEA